MAPPKPRSKRDSRAMDDDIEYSPLGSKKSKQVGFKGFLNGDAEKKNGFEE